MKELIAFLYGQHIGAFRQATSGSLSFQYFSEAESLPYRLSLALPFRYDSYPAKATKSFLEGLVPEGESARESLSRKFNVSAHNPFALLEHVGWDCAGAVQLVSPDEVEKYLSREGNLNEYSEEEIGRRLRGLSSPGQSWVMERERWSLAGAQSKFALRKIEDRWYEASGTEPTTHIFKPGIHDLKDQALNEHLCLKTLALIGLNTAKSEYLEFNGQPAIVVERYDRYLLEAGDIFRLHQEDFCQATSTLPRNKYESYKGPSALKIIQLLRQASSEEEVEKFVLGLIANYLLGAPDAHAKNYSIMHLPDGAIRLAPFYDVASGLPYESTQIPGMPGISNELSKSAMAISGERRFGKVSRKHWHKFAHVAGLDEGWLRDAVKLTAELMPGAMSQVIQSERDAVGDSALPERLLPRIQDLCDVTLTLLDRDL